ncbi:hypothetical protein [Rhizobium sp. BR 314]|uniref:hypothetical protein n=1 Tax=Rhizobium sp. BR 314 TaxID=3040013 RepID=UPI0039BF1CFC
MPISLVIPRVFMLLALLALGGCLSTPLSSLPKLARLNFLTMDFAEVRAGLRQPSALALRPGDFVMTVKTKTDGSSDETVDRFVLLETTEPAELQSLATEVKSGFALSAWRVAPTDVPRLAAIQERTRASLQHGPRVRGSIEITVTGGCTRETIPAGPLAVSTYLKPARGEGFITLSANADLRGMIAAKRQQVSLPRC